MASQSIPDKLFSSFQSIAALGKKYDNEDSPTEQYYGFLTKIEDVSYQAQWSVQFELVPKEWMDVAVLGLKSTVRSQPPASPATLLVFEDASPDDIAKNLSRDVDDIKEGDWYMITLGKGNPALRLRLRKSSSSPYKTKACGKFLGIKKSRKLSRRFRARGKISVKAIMNMLAHMQCDEIGVMDVGAGGCNLVYNDNGVPQFYVDVGLPMFANFNSMPPANPVTGFVGICNPGPCLANNPPVILTHWHWDHYTMAHFSNNAAALRNRHWVVPNQAFGGFANNVFSGIAPMNRHVMPGPLPGVLGGNVHVIQCVALAPAVGFNNTGLAVVVNVDNINNRRALLPGDAAFQCIPGVGAIAGLRWITATHHGSDTNIIAAQIPAAPNAIIGKIAYSYGIRPNGVHCYGHPRAAAINAYHARGWGPRGALDEPATAENRPNSGENPRQRGNILMCNNVIPPPCGVANCPFHVFPKTLV
ncbi:hypothetical protein DO021_16555 [Desulfobacter hydrogenophilus]|nr:hypothetical protein [Desulfobacter hydrogenophilus]NDY73027.1 hypothetical protein [Desulfobacter hydrogenophilus]RAM00875.1 hypothetical protein DO021_16555 [Desulfobacter hydrogenophilus]